MKEPEGYNKLKRESPFSQPVCNANMGGLAAPESGHSMTAGVKEPLRIILIVLLLAIGLSGCGKKTENNENKETILQTITPAAEPSEPAAEGELQPTITPSQVPFPTGTPTPSPNPYEGMKQSMLTGEWIPEEAQEHRPYAVMLNNIKAASPQSGIGQADIVYEALTEAGITRFLAIYSGIGEDTPAAERLGSVRSARHYFVSIADEYDAIFVHFGETTYAAKKMKALGIDHITGMYGVGVSSFYRDNSIKAPHNAFASLSGIEAAVKKGGFRTEYEEGYEAHFQFYEEDTEPENPSGDQVSRLTLGFSSYMSPYFVYHPEEKLYYRYQFDGEHVDYNTGEQLAFKNIIIQFVREWDIDKNGYQTMEIEEAEGTGYYITDGVLQPVTWKKSESRRFMRYYGEDGKELVINPGKTYIAVFPDNRTGHVTAE